MATKPTIFISAYRNVSVRYILYSDIFKELKKKDVRIVVFLKDNDLEYYRDCLGGENVILEPILWNTALRQLKGNRIQRFFVLVRKCMSGSEAGYENTTDKARLYQYGREMRMSRSRSGSPEFQLIRLLAITGQRVPAVRKAIVNLESRLFPGKMYDQYFEKYNPQMFIVSSLGYMIDPYFMRAAKRHGCKVISVIHNWDNPTTKDYRGAEPDHVIVREEIMKREVNVFHDIPNEKIHVGGIAHWDFYFNGQFKPGSKGEFLKSSGLSEDRKIIFYATSGYKIFRRTFDVIEQLLEAIEQGRFLFPAQLLVRLHPGYMEKVGGSSGQVLDRFKIRIETIRRKYGDLVSFTAPMVKVLNDDIDMPVEDMHRLAETLYHADVLLTEYSTVMIEAAIFDLPVVNVGLYYYRDTERPISLVENFTHIKRLLKCGASRNAYTIEQLIEYINYYLEDRSRDSESRRKLVDQEITMNRGCAGRKIAEYIYGLLD